MDVKVYLTLQYSQLILGSSELLRSFNNISMTCMDFLATSASQLSHIMHGLLFLLFHITGDTWR